MLTSLAFLFLLGLLLGYFFRKINLPSLLGMLIAGILLGPYGFDLLDDSLLSISPDLRKLALVIILTRAGLALDLKDLKKVGRPAILMSFVPACFEIAGITLLAPLFLKISYLEAALMGTVVAAVSPAVIVPKMLILMEKGFGKRKGIPQLIMAAGAVDDVFVIVLFTAFTGLLSGGKVEASDFFQIPLSIITGLGIGILTGWILSVYFKKFRLRDSVKVIILLSISFLLMALEAGLDGIVPVSGLLAVMSVSGTLYQTYPVLAKRLSSKFSKLWVGAEIFLFVLVGATVDIKYALIAGIAAVIVILLALLVRTSGVFLCLVKTPLNMKERLFCAFAYMPKATVQAAIGGIPLALGLPCGNIVLTVAVLAILITAPLGAFAIDVSYPKLLEQDEEKQS